jgi:predicted nucleic acid-binding protein
VIVVSDTSPLNYLIQIEVIEVVFRLFKAINIPGAVAAELSHRDAPEVTRAWIAKPPGTLHILEPEPVRDGALSRLHPGERAAILLAEQLSADLVILDDRAGRAVAIERSLRVIGTLAVLDEAGANGWLNIPEIVERLRKTGFRAHPSLYDWLIDRHQRRLV